MVIKFSEEQRLNAVKLYQNGNSVSQVEQLTGISANYVKNLLKKYNIQARPAGFQKGNLGRQGKSQSIDTKNKISKKHKLSGHRPSSEASIKGQPLALKIRWKDHIKDPVDKLIKSYKSGALKRNLEFTLTRHNFELFIYQECFYCGAKPSLRKLSGCSLICNGIDRIDNSVGYIVDNCTTACKVCNVMKSSKKCIDFIEHCSLVAARFKNG